jgi:hypothetical protein
MFHQQTQRSWRRSESSCHLPFFLAAEQRRKSSSSLSCGQRQEVVRLTNHESFSQCNVRGRCSRLCTQRRPQAYVFKSQLFTDLPRTITAVMTGNTFRSRPRQSL